MANNQEIVQTIRSMFLKLWERRRVFYVVVPLVVLLSCVYIVCIPRIYVSSVTLAPETDNTSWNGLRVMTSSFGLDVDDVKSNDALYPMLYPDIIGSKLFMLSLLDMPVVTADGQSCTYKEFLQHQKVPFWQKPRLWLQKKWASRNGEGAPATEVSGTVVVVDPATDNLLLDLKSNLSCEVDMRTEMVSLSAKSQDPRVAALLADSARARLQQFIADYRTQKARENVRYYTTLVEQSEKDYQSAVESCNGNVGKLQNGEAVCLKNDMELKQMTLNNHKKRLATAEAQLQESKPAFTVVEPAFVPTKAAQPKRMVFVATMTLLSIFVTAGWILRKELIEWF